MILKEVCVDNINDAINAYECGANRIEFCSNLDHDGLTPKIDELLTLSNTIDIPIRCMLRPHACLLYTSPSPRDGLLSRMPSSA